MGVDPHFGLLAGGGDLFLGHLCRQPFEAALAVFVTLSEGKRGPEVGFTQILRNSAPRPIVGAERGLRGGVALFGGPLEPLHGLYVITRNALAAMVARSQLPLRLCVPLFGERSQ